MGGAREILGARVVDVYGKTYLLNTTRPLHACFHSSYDYTNKTSLKSSQPKSQNGRGEAHEVPSLAEKLLVMDGCCVCVVGE